MRRVLVALLTVSLLGGSALFAKTSPTTKKGDITKIKKEKIAKLEAKKAIIEKRISCIKKANSAKEIKMCEKKYPLVKRSKKAKKMKTKVKKQNKK